jgi:DNA-binding XRE family transcriptional regulator
MTADDFRAARKAMNHTQHTMAAALEMGRHGWQTISAWETGKQPVPGPVRIAMRHLSECKPKA